MNTHHHRSFNRLTIFGLFALVLANTVQYVLTRHTTYSEHVVDPISGFLFGVAIATTLLGVIRQSRQLRGREDRCA
jgi:hypothetical protein